jgi:hypothetical protein
MDTRIIELLEACYDEELSLMSGDLGKSTYNHDVHPPMRSLQGVFPFAGGAEYGNMGTPLSGPMVQ